VPQNNCSAHIRPPWPANHLVSEPHILRASERVTSWTARLLYSPAVSVSRRLQSPGRRAPGRGVCQRPLLCQFRAATSRLAV